MRLLVFLPFAALLLAGCPTHQPIQCASDTDCDFVAGGTCAGSSGGLGWCAYPAGDCPSGYRYATDIGGGLAGICVEDDGGIDGSDVTPPTITARSPDTAATNVARSASVSVMFSEPIATATVTAASFEVRTASASVIGQLSVSGSNATFTASTALDPSTQYTVTLSTAITDLAGNHLAASSSWTFTTGTATWAPPVLLETEMNMKASDLRVASGGSIVFATWLMASCNGTLCQPPSQLWYSIRQAGTWSPGAAVAGVTGTLGAPAVVVDSTGRAAVVFSQTIGARSSMYAAHYASSTWSGPMAIESDDAGDAILPSAAVDPSGHVFAAWQQHDGTRQNAMANRFVPGTGWGSAIAIEQSTTSISAQPTIAVGAVDGAFAAWPQGGNIMGARYTAGSWGPASVAGAGVEKARVAVHSDGAAIVIWPTGSGTSANRNTGAWGTAQEIDALGSATASPIALEMAMGNAIALWPQNGDLWQARFEPASGWGSAFRIESAGGLVVAPSLALAPNGSGLSTWEQPSPGSSGAPWANLLSPATGWGAAQLAKPDDGVVARTPTAFFDPAAGTFGAAWLAAPSGYTSVYAATLQ